MSTLNFLSVRKYSQIIVGTLSRPRILTPFSCFVFYQHFLCRVTEEEASIEIAICMAIKCMVISTQPIFNGPNFLPVKQALYLYVGPQFFFLGPSSLVIVKS